MDLKRKRAAENPFRNLSDTAQLGRGAAPVELASEIEAAGQELRRFLIGRYSSGRLSGDELALIAWWATKAGATGVSDLALDPRAQNTRRNAHVELVLGREIAAPDTYTIEAPGHDKLSAARCKLEIPVRLVHETLPAFYAGELPGSERPWPPAVLEHSEVRRALAAGRPMSHIAPLALYWDSVSYTKNDNLFAFYFHDLRLQRRFLCAMARPGLSA
jgi:hypothetical protein